MSNATTRKPQPKAKSSRAKSPLQVAVVGCGYWGPNLIRNFSNCPDTHVAVICDQDQSRVDRVESLCPNARQTHHFDDVVEDTAVDAVAIATPVCTHAPLGSAALANGKHVLIEKPLTASVREAEELVELAASKKRTLMVDHTFVYSPQVRKIKNLLESGDIGDLYFIDSVRINLGLFQHDVNVVWDLAPHDISILDYLVGRLPRSIAAFGKCHTNNQNEIEDVAYVTLDFGEGLMASVHVNWLSPVKVRHCIIGGSKKSIVYNDLEPAEKVKVYDRGITIDRAEDRHRMLIGYRTGDVWIPHLETFEPLQTMVQHFAHCIRTGESPITDGEAGMRVVRVLDASQRSIKAQGGRITL